MDNKSYYIKQQYILESVAESLITIDEEIRAIYRICMDNTTSASVYYDREHAKLIDNKRSIIDEAIDKLIKIKNEKDNESESGEDINE